MRKRGIHSIHNKAMDSGKQKQKRWVLLTPKGNIFERFTGKGSAEAYLKQHEKSGFQEGFPLILAKLTRHKSPEGETIVRAA